MQYFVQKYTFFSAAVSSKGYLFCRFEDELDREVEDFELQVSSPGLDAPIVTERQYTKNIGRDIIVSLESGKDLKGKLEVVQDSGISLLEIVQKGNRKAKTYAKEVTELSFQDILKHIGFPYAFNRF